MKINIIGKGKKEKGESFEDIVKAILTGFGFTSFRKDIQTIGMEFDLKATHKTNGDNILCECKAHAKPIATPH